MAAELAQLAVLAGIIIPGKFVHNNRWYECYRTVRSAMTGK